MQATGGFICCSTYFKPPLRNWSYDRLFDTTQPPGAPMGMLGASKGRWSQS